MKPEWAKKLPKSSKICLYCYHKYGSHVPVCIKIISKHPVKISCDCTQFIGSIEELRMAIKKEKNPYKLLIMKENLKNEVQSKRVQQVCQ